MSKHLVIPEERPWHKYRESRKAYAKRNAYKQPEYSKRWVERNPEQRLITVAKQRAKKYGLDFTISKEDIKVPESCPILGIKLEFAFGKGSGGKPHSPSLDRIDNTKGYIKGNVQVISHLANQMKSTADKDQLKRFADWILKTYD